MRWGFRLGRLSLRHRRCFAALSMKFDQHGWVFILSEAKDLRCFSVADERVKGDGGCDGRSAWAGCRCATGDASLRSAWNSINMAAPPPPFAHLLPPSTGE